ncbi:M56 family metallopeptidase [Lacrimispora defluvii]|uniref:M56 family metallopeptidase n=1 Tax=Lacrimispora defluvii TaxID=2719233 RepID=A0ABX1VZ37_9FIRM|nr:M56 family metallopeptidase [Lacrimispora defluvii]NNJ33330.1 M56 family metallopeptidase [Lacrimispora defluvii]
MIERIGMAALAMCIGATILRLFIPFELTTSRNMPIGKLLPALIRFLEIQVIQSGGITISLLDALYIIWVSGIIIQLVKTIYIYNRFAKTITNSRSVIDDEVKEAFYQLNSDYNKPFSIQIIQTDLISTPMVFGFYRPRIILPGIKLTTEEWYCILKHELSHYICGDLWVKFLVEFLCSIYWWNPFVYLFRNQISKAQEIHIDLFVTKSMNEEERFKYLECLIKIAKIPVSRKLNKWILSFNGESGNILSQRFNIILNLSNSSDETKGGIFLTLLLPVLLLLVLSFSIVFEPCSIKPQDAADTVELTNQNSYLIQNPESGYDVYLNGQFYGHIDEIKDSFSDLQIYKNITEVSNNEKNR